MSKQDKQKINNQQSQIEDLAVNEAQTAEIKGGFRIGPGESFTYTLDPREVG